MEDFKLENIDHGDIEDLLEEVEKSFNIKFVGNELIGIRNFGELCDHITKKIQLEDIDDCTSQQAFYKLRNVISTELSVNQKEITIKRKLEELFPKKIRRSNLKKIEEKLGFKLKILTAPNWVMFPLIVIFLLSFICFFFSWKIALSGIAFSTLGFWMADMTANEIELENVGQLVERMTRENYLQSRRKQETFNKKEIEKVLRDWFSDKLGLEKTKLTRDAKFL
ncbi:hypothetical protein EZ428_22465 [Pedobacter frigiditerrae]|uniref:Uncharacterized protein n=1 Tax=Pedobacter frigiditerrae TaxID=2530452 RepID=A0A4R0MLC1_9SPHI|nr:hypothetical protein [Pedobacter frigiditerrae]TCC86972.1 hypothetical protein EZ428_22465 [Pedobacter frigiditerrae]